MASDTEKLELLFRRQHAIELPANASRPAAVYRLDLVPTLVASACVESHSLTDAVRRRSGDRPVTPPIPSTGYFNVARVPTTASVWLLVVGATKRKRFEGLMSTLLAVQSAKQSFKFVFVLDDLQDT